MKLELKESFFGRKSMFATLNIKMYCFDVKLIEIKFSIFLNFFDVISKFFRSFFRSFFSMFCLSILCLFYIFAFLCFVVLCFVIDPLGNVPTFSKVVGQGHCPQF